MSKNCISVWIENLIRVQRNERWNYTNRKNNQKILQLEVEQLESRTIIKVVIY